MPTEPLVHISSFKWFQELHRWATAHAFMKQSHPCPQQYPLLACGVDLSNTLTLFYKGASWAFEPVLYPVHSVRLRTLSLPDAPGARRSIPIHTNYTSMLDFIDNLCQVMDSSLHLGTGGIRVEAICG